jgi:L-arabinokinase
VSGHGFGHSIRQIAIINAISALDPSIPILVRTSAPPWLFEKTARGRCRVLASEVDTGVVQRDSLTLDERKTIERAEAFYRRLDDRASDEAALLRQHAARLVVADAPPLACAAAARAAVPSVVCANFTWDWIYAGYAESLGVAPLFLPAVRDAYARADAGWRMPMHGGFDTVPAIIDLPFVAREPKSDRTRDDIRRVLHVPVGIPLALVSFGGYGVEGLPLDRLDCTASWAILLTGVNPGLPGSMASRSSERTRTRVFVLDESLMYSSGLGYEDVVRAADVVITKPGYGIISDCIAGGTAMLYTSRGRFAEYDVLVAEMPRYLRCRFLDQEALREGRWLNALDALMASPPPPERPRIDGARTAAEMIAQRI